MTRAGLFLISWLPWPRSEAPALSALSANEEKLASGLMLSCLIFITATGFHARTIFITTKLSGGHIGEAHYDNPHKNSLAILKNSPEKNIFLNIWSSEMYKGLAIYIWPAGRERGGGKALAGEQRGEQTRSWLGLSWSIIQRGRGHTVPSTGLHPQHSPCTQHYQNIDQRNIKTSLLSLLNRLKIMMMNSPY